MPRQTDEKQILKFYIRLLLYIDDIHNKYRNIENAKSSSDSDDPGSGYLKFIRRKKEDLIEQLKDNLNYNKEDPNGVSIDNTFVRLFKQEEQKPAQTASEASEVEPEVKPEVKPESAQKLAQTAAALPLAAVSALSEAGLAETLSETGELDE